jgi:hypothetical protein
MTGRRTVLEGLDDRAAAQPEHLARDAACPISRGEGRGVST